MKTKSLLESLEARIAPAVLLNATTVMYTDSDGDAVTVKTTEGAFDLSQFTFAQAGAGGIFAAGSTKFIRIEGKLQGADGASHTGVIEIGGNLNRLTIDSGIIGGEATLNDTTHSGGVFVGGKLGRVHLLEGIYGGDSMYSGALEYSGCIKAGSIGKARIEGSVDSGYYTSTGDYFGNGAIIADKVESLRIDGSLIGYLRSHAGIYVGTNAGDGDGHKNVVLKDLYIGGDVDNANIIAGATPGNVLSVNSEVQIGKVRVHGDWLLSNLAAGVSRGEDGYYGTDDDLLFGSNPLNTGVVSSIAKVVIKGRVEGSLFNQNDHYGFVAERIGSFQVNGVKVGLTPGANSPGDSSSSPAPATRMSRN